jgi:hypothetical protein
MLAKAGSLMNATAGLQWAQAKEAALLQAFWWAQAKEAALRHMLRLGCW